MERKGRRTLWVVSGLQNGAAMKRYSTTLFHRGQKCSLVAYLLDGDNLPPASFIFTPPSPFEMGLPRTNELNQAGGTYHPTNKSPELPSSAKERIKNVVEALAMELKVDMPNLLSTIQEVFGGRLGNVEPGKTLEEYLLSTRCVSSYSA